MTSKSWAQVMKWLLFTLCSRSIWATEDHLQRFASMACWCPCLTHNQLLEILDFLRYPLESRAKNMENANIIFYPLKSFMSHLCHKVPLEGSGYSTLDNVEYLCLLFKIVKAMIVIVYQSSSAVCLYVCTKSAVCLHVASYTNVFVFKNFLFVYNEKHLIYTISCLLHYIRLLWFTWIFTKVVRIFNFQFNFWTRMTTLPHWCPRSCQIMTRKIGDFSEFYSFDIPFALLFF